MEPTKIKVNDEKNVFELTHHQIAILEVGSQRYLMRALLDKMEGTVTLRDQGPSSLSVSFSMYDDHHDGITVNSAVIRPMVYGDVRYGQFFGIEGEDGDYEAHMKSPWETFEDDIEVQLLDVKKSRAVEGPIKQLWELDLYDKIQIEIGGITFSGTIGDSAGSYTRAVTIGIDKARLNLPSASYCKLQKTWNCWISVPIGSSVICEDKCGFKVNSDELMLPSGNLEKIGREDGPWLLTKLEPTKWTVREFVDRSDLTVEGPENE